jgi:hypothetical protein
MLLAQVEGMPTPRPSSWSRAEGVETITQEVPHAFLVHGATLYPGRDGPSTSGLIQDASPFRTPTHKIPPNGIAAGANHEWCTT